MAIAKKTEANRRNVLKSTDFKILEGKAAIRLSILGHSLLSGKVFPVEVGIFAWKHSKDLAEWEVREYERSVDIVGSLDPKVVITDEKKRRRLGCTNGTLLNMER